MQLRQRPPAVSVLPTVLTLTILASSWGMLGEESYAQGGSAPAASEQAADEQAADIGGGTCDGCLDLVRDDDENALGTRDFITGIADSNSRTNDRIPAPSAAVFSLALFAIGTAVFFIRRCFATSA